MEEKPVLRPVSKSGYMRDSLTGKGYKGIIDKLNIFEARDSSRTGRVSRYDAAGNHIGYDIKVKDLVSRFESAAPSKIPKATRIHKQNAATTSAQPMGAIDNGNSLTTMRKIRSGTPSKISEATKNRNSATNEMKNTDVILRATVKIITGINVPEAPLMIRRESTNTGTKTEPGLRSVIPVPTIRKSLLKNKEVSRSSNEAANRLTKSINSNVNRDSEIVNGTKGNITSRVPKYNKPSLSRSSVLRKENGKEEGNKGKLKNDDILSEPLGVVCENAYLTRPKSGSGIENGKCNAAATENGLPMGNEVTQKTIRCNENNKNKPDTSLSSRVKERNEEEERSPTDLIKFGFSRKTKMGSNKNCSTFIPSGESHELNIHLSEDECHSSESELSESSKYFNRTTWRSKALRKKRIDGSDQSTETKNILEQQELFQTYSEMEEENLRQSIIKNETNIEMVANYLLVRNGNKATIRILKEMNSTPHDTITGPGITLWQNLNQVLTSGILDTMTKQQISQQEALFEIISSQASYVKSLIVLEEYLMPKIKVRVPYVLKEKEFNELFFHIKPMFAEERNLLDDMLELCAEDIMMSNLCDLVAKHYGDNREMYLKYGRHQDSVLSHFRQICETNLTFDSIIKDLTNSREAGFLPFDSYMNLPMQRVTKMPLLFKTVIAQLEEFSLSYTRFNEALGAVERVAQDLNEEAGKMKRWEEMLKLDRELSLPDVLVRLPLIQISRSIVLRSWCRKMAGKKSKIELILFNDIFVVAKKSNTQGQKPLQVCDFTKRNCLIVRDTSKTAIRERTPLMTLQFLSDMHKRQMTLTVTFEKTSDHKRWINVLSSVPKSEANEEIHSQVIITKKYDQKFQDELNLSVGDVVMVIFNETDGWSLGEKLVDGTRGWFRISDSQAINSPSDIQFMQKLRISQKDSEEDINVIENTVTDESFA